MTRETQTEPRTLLGSEASGIYRSVLSSSQAHEDQFRFVDAVPRHAAGRDSASSSALQ